MQALKDVFQVIFTDRLVLGKDGNELQMGAGLVPVYTKFFYWTEVAQEHVVRRICAGERGRGSGRPTGLACTAFIESVEGTVGEKMEAEGVVITSVGVSRRKKGLQVEEFVPLAYHSNTGNHLSVPCIEGVWFWAFVVWVRREEVRRLKNACERRTSNIENISHQPAYY